MTGRRRTAEGGDPVEELPCRIMACDVGLGDQFGHAFLRMNHQRRMPTLMDGNPPGRGGPAVAFGSAAIMLHWAEQASRFWPQDLRGRR